MGAYRNGDRVRVVLEGEVCGASKTDDAFTVGYNRIRPEFDHVVSIEKVEPPVVTFKPGQLLRGLENSLYYTLMPDGYLVWGSDGQGFWQPGDLERRFTSRDFELIELK